MGATTNIQWTDATWNPWSGCTKVSEGCARCYMYRDKERWGKDGSVVVRSGKGVFTSPLQWWLSGKVKPGGKIFTCSFSDFFIEQADGWREEAWNIIRRTPGYTYQILTKRPERIMQCLPPDWGNGYENVWLGVSVENNEQRSRMDKLLEVPATIRFVSFEPLLEMIKVVPLILEQYDWAIIGGESGFGKGKYKARECRMMWITSIIEQCRAARVKVFVKQAGSVLAREMGMNDFAGGDMSEWPAVMQVREMPETITNYQ
jgi:protein gp37